MVSHAFIDPMNLLFGYAAGLLTLINPCVLPVLPIVLASAVQSHRLGPVALAGGMSLAFVALGIGIATVGRFFGLDQEIISQAAAIVMILFGLVLLIPRLNAGFATATAGFASRADEGLERVDQTGLHGQFLGGMLLGAVWSPCIGPTLGGAIALAWQGESLGLATGIMLSFALGVSTIILVLAYGARATILKRQAAMRALAGRARPIMGVLFVGVGVGLLFGVHHMAESWAVQNLPAWLIDLSVSL